MKTFLSKLMVLAIACGVSLSGVAGWGLFNSHYDPYYNNYNYYHNYTKCDGCKHHHKHGNKVNSHKKGKCNYRVSYKSVDRPCKKVRSADCKCKKVMSISTFSSRELRNAPYQPMKDLYVNVFRGWF